MGCHALFQGIFPTQGSNPVSCIAGRFFTTEPPGKPLKYPLFEYQLYVTVDTTLIQTNICWFYYEMAISTTIRMLLLLDANPFPIMESRSSSHWKFVGHGYTTCLKCWNDFPIIGVERISLVWSVSNCLMFQPHFAPLCLSLHFRLSVFGCTLPSLLCKLSSCREWGLLFIVVHWFLMWWLLIAETSSRVSRFQ